MITISEIARLAGTTPRAVRLYHARGLLPEPPRADNGYRAYGPDDLLALLRIRRMRELGLPLSRIAELVRGPDASLRAALASLDDDLARQERALAARRATLATVLAMPGDLTLPPPVAELLAAARAAGYPEEVLTRERDAVLIALAVEPEALDALVEFYRRLLAEPADRVRAASDDYELLASADADDPRIEDVAARTVEAIGAVLDAMSVPEGGDPGTPAAPPDAAQELLDRFMRDRSSPAQRRVDALVMEALADRLGGIEGVFPG